MVILYEAFHAGRDRDSLSMEIHDHTHPSETRWLLVPSPARSPTVVELLVAEHAHGNYAHTSGRSPCPSVHRGLS